MRDRSASRRQRLTREEEAKERAFERAKEIDAGIVAGLLDQSRRQDEQIRSLLSSQTSMRNELAELQEANLKFRLREIEVNETVAALTRRISSLQGENTKIRRRMRTLEELLREANIPFEPEEVSGE